MKIQINAYDPYAAELLTRAIKWIDRLVDRRKSIPSFFDNDADPAPLAKDIRRYLKRGLNEK